MSNNRTNNNNNNNNNAIPAVAFQIYPESIKMMQIAGEMIENIKAGKFDAAIEGCNSNFPIAIHPSLTSEMNAIRCLRGLAYFCRGFTTNNIKDLIQAENDFKKIIQNKDADNITNLLFGKYKISQVYGLIAVEILNKYLGKNNNDGFNKIINAIEPSANGLKAFLHFLDGEFKLKAKQHHEAVAAFTAGIQYFKGSIFFYFRALAYYKLGFKDEALEDATQCVTKNQCSDTYKLDGYFNLMTGNYKQAVLKFEMAAVASGPDINSPENLMLRNVAYCFQKQYDPSVNKNKLTEIINENFRALCQIYNKNGVNLISQFHDEFFYEMQKAIFSQHVTRNTQDAIKYFTRAIQLNPDFALAYSLRAEVYMHLQAPTGFILADLNKAIELAHSGIDYMNRARILIELKEYEKALDDVNNAMINENKEPATYKLRGELYFRSGKFKEAIKDLETAIDQGYDKQQCGPIYHMLGDAYIEIGKVETAIENYKLADAIYGSVPVQCMVARTFYISYAKALAQRVEELKGQDGCDTLAKRQELANLAEAKYSYALTIQAIGPIPPGEYADDIYIAIGDVIANCCENSVPSVYNSAYKNYVKALEVNPKNEVACQRLIDIWQNNADNGGSLYQAMEEIYLLEVAQYEAAHKRPGNVFERNLEQNTNQESKYESVYEAGLRSRFKRNANKKAQNALTNNKQVTPINNKPMNPASLHKQCRFFIIREQDSVMKAEPSLNPKGFYLNLMFIPSFDNFGYTKLSKNRPCLIISESTGQAKLWGYKEGEFQLTEMGKVEIPKEWESEKTVYVSSSHPIYNTLNTGHTQKSRTEALLALRNIESETLPPFLLHVEKKRQRKAELDTPMLHWGPEVFDRPTLFDSTNDLITNELIQKNRDCNEYDEFIRSNPELAQAFRIFKEGKEKKRRKDRRELESMMQQESHDDYNNNNRNNNNNNTNKRIIDETDENRNSKKPRG